MSDYKALLEKKRELDAQIEQVRKVEITEAKAKARAIVSEYDLSPEDVFSSIRRSANVGKTVVPKYRDPATGQTWTGRGKAPKWIAGQDRGLFLI